MPASDPVEALIVDLLQWLSKEERDYAEVMEAWRTSCPRLPVWEEATDRGLVARERRNGQAIVTVSTSGHEFLRTHAHRSSGMRV